MMAPTAALRRALRVGACVAVVAAGAAAPSDEVCAGGCAGDEVGLLQSQLQDVRPHAEAKSAGARKRGTIDLSNIFDKVSQVSNVSEGHIISRDLGCPNNYGCAINVNNAKIAAKDRAKYWINKIKGDGTTIGDSGYGPAKACFEFDSRFEIDLTEYHDEIKNNADKITAPNSKWTVKLTLEIYAYVMWNWVKVTTMSMSCPLCGCVCKTPAIKILNMISIDPEDFEMPDCGDMNADGTEQPLVFDVLLPPRKKLPVGVRIVGSAEVTDEADNFACKADFEVEMNT